MDDHSKRAGDPKLNPFAGAYVPPYPPDDIDRIPTPGGLHPEDFLPSRSPSQRSTSQRSSEKRQSVSSDGRARSRADSSASRNSSIYQHHDPDSLHQREEEPQLLVLPEFDSTRFQRDEVESLSELGERTLEKWNHLDGSLVISRWNVNALCALVVYLHREKETDGLASYVLDHLALSSEMYVPPSKAPNWPRSSNRPDPDFQISPSHKLRIEWLGHQVLQTFFRLQEIGIVERIRTSPTTNKLLSEKQHLYLLELFILDIFSRTSVPALQFDWSPALWHRLDDRLVNFDPYRKAFEFFRRITQGVAWEMAEEVEDWVEKEIKGRIGRRSKIDREVLPKGEISSRILRVWSSLHNALEPETPWEIPAPPSETPPVSGIRRNVTILRRRATYLLRRDPRVTGSESPHEVVSRHPKERGGGNVLKKFFSRNGKS